MSPFRIEPTQGARERPIAFFRLQCYNLCYCRCRRAPVTDFCADPSQHISWSRIAFQPKGVWTSQTQSQQWVRGRKKKERKNKIENSHLIGLSVYNNRRAREKKVRRAKQKKCEFYVLNKCVYLKSVSSGSSPMNEIESATQHDEECTIQLKSEENEKPTEVVENIGNITLSAFITLITTSIGIRLNLCNSPMQFAKRARSETAKQIFWIIHICL